MSAKIFIAGTDTDVGKTYVSTGLLQGYNKLGLSTLGLKPVATGCFYKGGIGYNNDALALQHFSSIKLQYHNINPLAYEPPIAPNIAAQQENSELTINMIMDKTNYALNICADIIIVEGVGGWYVPLNLYESMADFVSANQFPVILVVGIRLGCINHAILTCQAIQRSKVSLVGWIANCCDPTTQAQNEIIATLKSWLKTALLGVINHQSSVDACVDLNKLFDLINN